MVMAEYFSHDRLQELWHKIHHLHLSFLDTEDSPQKIEQRSKLEVCIREYLCIAPHNRKFYCSETAEVLHRSASSKKDFSGYRAALAWNAVSMYAGNLLSQPWRKEYRQIKTYCGFYKHQIEANLVGAEAMFEAMGYKHAGDGVLVLEGPVCPDRVANVSQDSIVAFVECQILKTIWEEVSTNFKVSWLDVLEFRETHLYSPEQSIRMLNFRFHERRYQEQQQHHQQQQQQQQQQHRGYSADNSVDAYSTLLRYNTPGPVPMHSAPYTPQCPSHCIYSHGHTPSYYHHAGYTPAHQHPTTYQPLQQTGPYPRYGTIPYHVPVCKPCNGYCYPNGCVSGAGYTCPAVPVPTAQLIELDNNHTMHHNPGQTHNGLLYDNNAKLDAHKQLARATNLDSLTLSKSKEDGAGTFESWDFVYRNLESQGYYKDLGDRPDVLHTPADKKKHTLRDAKKTRPSIELEDQLTNLNLTDTLSKPNETLRRLSNDITRKPRAEDTRVPPSSSYDNISTQQHKPQQQHQIQPSKSVSNGVAKTAKTLPRERVSEKASNHVSVSTIDGRKPVAARKSDVKTTDTTVGWNCNTCTYLNTGGTDICVICSKSRRKVEQQALAVGGPQCPRCTLVNQKDASVCQACDASLLNSPTYI